MAENKEANIQANSSSNIAEAETIQGSKNNNVGAASENEVEPHARPAEQPSRKPFTSLSQEDADLKLARALQEQEMAYMLLHQNNAEPGGYETSGSSYSDNGIADDNVQNEDAFDASGDEQNIVDLRNIGADEIDPSLFDSDEAFARALQDAEDREMTARMMAMAGINDVEEDIYDDTDDGQSQDAWQDADPDNLEYEELIALGEVVGTESRGLSQDLISSLPVSKFEQQSPCCINQERCVICCVEYENGEDMITLLCKHNYHSECISGWLQINKVCPVCNEEVSTQRKGQ